MDGRLAEKRERLRRDYLDSLPTKLERLRVAWAQFADSGDVESLITEAHKLAGSAPLYGLKDAGSIASSLEQVLRNGDNDAATLVARAEPDFDALLACLKGHIALRAEAGDDDAVKRDPERHRFLFIAPQSPHLDGLVGVLQARGAKVTQCDPHDAVDMKLDHAPGLILIDGDSIDPHILSVLLEHIRTRIGAAPIMAVYSGHDDFESRLAAVHSGADVFLLAPLDADVVFTTLTGMSMQREAEPFRVLVIEDDADQAKQLMVLLESAEFAVRHVAEMGGLLPTLFDFRPEIIIVDFHMPTYDGVDVTRVLRQHEVFFDLPILFFSGDRRSHARVLAAEAGADAFLAKNMDDQYLVRLVRSRVFLRRRTQVAVSRDALTGLLNRRALDERLEYEIERAQREGQVFSLALIDLDRFKSINDRFGHMVGDEAIKHIARILIMELRNLDVAGRYGGDEMMVFMPATGREGAMVVLERVRDRMAAMGFTAGRATVELELSMGLLEARADKSSAPVAIRDTVTEAVDKLLYEAKRGGRGKIVAGTHS